MGGPRILVADSPESWSRDLSLERSHLPADCEIQRFCWRGDVEALADAARYSDAILTDFVPFGADVLERLENCRMISVSATGFDAVDVKRASELGISVCCVGEYCTEEVADHSLALMLALNRKLLQYHRQVQQDRSWAWNDIRGIFRLKGQVLGIIGMGRIGRAVARRARAFGLRIMAYDPLLSGEKMPEDVASVPLPELLQQSNIITLHCNYDPHKAAMLDQTAFEAMTQRPMLINVARGGLVDEAALVSALEHGQLAGAALDVLSGEPPELDGHPLLERENVIITPHVAFFSEQSVEQVRVISAANITAFLDGRFAEVYRFVHHARGKPSGEKSWA
jgi:D-3-phosphoglycerate dehydrogenase